MQDAHLQCKGPDLLPLVGKQTRRSSGMGALEGVEASGGTGECIVRYTVIIAVDDDLKSFRYYGQLLFMMTSGSRANTSVGLIAVRS